MGACPQKASLPHLELHSVTRKKVSYMFYILLFKTAMFLFFPYKKYVKVFLSYPRLLNTTTNNWLWNLLVAVYTDGLEKLKLLIYCILITVVLILSVKDVRFYEMTSKKDGNNFVRNQRCIYIYTDSLKPSTTSLRKHQKFHNSVKNLDELYKK